MNLHLKKYILNAKGNAIRLGFRLKISETVYDTIALVSNQSSEKVARIFIEIDPHKLANHLL